MIKWLNKAGNDVETTDHPGDIKAAKAAGWAPVEESAQMEIEVDEASKKSKSKGKK